MTATLPVPTRYLVALGVAVLAALALLVARPLLTGDATETAAPVAPARTATTPSTTATTKPAKPIAPRVVLLDGLPKAVAARLRHSRVVVVALYAGTSSSDRAAAGDARNGARASGAGFTALNVLDEATARELQSLVGAVSTPAVLVVRRPGTVVTQLDGRADSAIVEQAAHNAGARR